VCIFVLFCNFFYFILVVITIELIRIKQVLPVRPSVAYVSYCLRTRKQKGIEHENRCKSFSGQENSNVHVFSKKVKN